MYQFFVEENQLAGDRISILGSDVNHIKNVLRMKVDEELLISNGQDKDYYCKIEAISDDEIKALMEETSKKRMDKQPLEFPSAGSTFKRPEGSFAGKLIEDAGLKGFALDDSGAQVSPKHAGFVVNNGGTAKASDVMRLIDYVVEKVYEDSGVRLEKEVRLVGNFGG